MKTSSIYMSVLAVAALCTMAACTSQGPETAEPQAPKMVKVSFTASAPAASKATYDGDTDFKWEEGDSIAVTYRVGEVSGNVREFAKLKATSVSSDGKTATFEGEIADGGVLNGAAIYPYGIADHEYKSYKAIYMPSEYAYDAVSAPHSMPMYATITEGDSNVKFSHLCGMVKFEYKDVPAEATKLVVNAFSVDVAQKAKKITSYGVAKGFTVSDAGTITTAEIDIADSEKKIVGQINSYGSEVQKNRAAITVNLPEGRTTVQDMTFYIPLPLGDYPHLGVRLENETSYWTEQASTKSHTIAKSNIIRFPQFATVGTKTTNLAAWEYPVKEPNLSNISFSVTDKKSSAMIADTGREAGKASFTYNIVIGLGKSSSYKATTFDKSGDPCYCIRQTYTGDYFEITVPVTNVVAGDKFKFYFELFTTGADRLWNLSYKDGDSWIGVGTDRKYSGGKTAGLEIGPATFDIGYGHARTFNYPFVETITMSNAIADGNLIFRLTNAPENYGTDESTTNSRKVIGTFRLGNIRIEKIGE